VGRARCSRCRMPLDIALATTKGCSVLPQCLRKAAPAFLESFRHLVYTGFWALTSFDPHTWGMVADV
jgi:hypothetical protein